MILLSANQIFKSYGKKDALVHALNGVTLQILKGEMAAIMGKSGSGKSTLLNIMGGLLSADSGTLEFDGKVLQTTSRRELTLYRRNQVGFVVQYFALIPDLTIYENVALPLRYQNIPNRTVSRMTRSVLEQMGIGDKEKAYPDELSGGQQQRAAIARAIVKKPQLLLADEPTGALDEATEDEVLEIFQNLKREGMTIVMVTHDDKVAQTCDRVVYLKDGKCVGDDKMSDRDR